ncbi:Indoleamine 2,3-dioxygenase [Multifurca ochricompacta]|uniref:Indoleamine 2,3-dioxygenase n=1 Tax=Multifurca ochricompacta TaxID=376703 RepID=A0AAD4QS94_9AGAM|nr:Indoleamine 2,3-dioxygenase [Multifurca ochricompacta]
MSFISGLPHRPFSYFSVGHFFQVLNAVVLGLESPETTADFKMEDYNVDYATGFFPQQPLPRLSGEFELWENVLDDAEGNISLGEDTRESAKAKRPYGEIWRQRVRNLPLLNTDHLAECLLQRAHMVLAFLINFYVHSQPPNASPTPIHIPECLAIPIVNVSRELGIAPVLTFADTVLWNAKPADSQLPMSANNISLVHTFSSTDTERNYHIVSAKAELRGVEILRIIEDYAQLSDVADLHTVSKTARDLRRLVTVVQDLTDIMQNVKDTADPYGFYWEVRPWFRGSDCGASRWIYDGVPESDSLDLGGPSAGQSTTARQEVPAPSEENKKADRGFMERMRRYMPGSHQAYLRDLAALPVPIRSLAKTSPLLRESYDLAILALKKFRDMHMRIACLYIISMAKTTPPGTPEEGLERQGTQQKGPAKGTGGSHVSSLLKAGRDATNRALLKPPSMTP